MTLTFFKYQGTGNDFVILDNRKKEIPTLTTEQIKNICDRRFGIGADGLMLLGEKAGYDFEMIYYNSDGNESSMCGNGGRCLVAFAHEVGIHKGVYNFWAVDGEHKAEIESDHNIRLKMKDVSTMEQHTSWAVVNTGSPHYVKIVPDAAVIDVFEAGREIRYSEEYKKEGINVNFVETLGNDTIFVRTYERGVENETLSCGTGVTAAALVSAHNDNGFNRVEVKTPGGHLSVEFDKTVDDTFNNIWLCGPALLVFKGEVTVSSK